MLTNHQFFSKVLELVYEATDITPAQILSRERTAPIVSARHVTWWLLRQNGWALKQIASKFSVDHSSVLCATRKVDGQITLRAEGLGDAKAREAYAVAKFVARGLETAGVGL